MRDTCRYLRLCETGWCGCGPCDGPFWLRRQRRLKADNLTWTAGKTYRTKGSKETRTINLAMGTYRVVVAGKYGYQGATSPPST